MKTMDLKIMESAIEASGIGPKADMLKSMHDNEIEKIRAADGFGWHNFDDIKTLVGLEGNYFWAEDPFRPNSIQFQFDPDKIGFQGTYNISGKEEGVFRCLPNNAAIGYAIINLVPEGGGMDRVFVISGLMADAEWKISIMLMNKLGNQGLIQPPFSAIRMV